MEFTGAGFKAFREDMKKALEAVENKHGIKMELGDISYSDVDFKFRITAVKNNSNIDGRKALFEKYCSRFGFKPNDYEMPVIYNGEKYLLIGFNLRARKNCCNILKLSDGVIYRCSAEFVKLYSQKKGA